MPAEGGPAPTSTSEGDSARTIQGNGSAGAHGAGFGYQAPRRAVAPGGTHDSLVIGDMDIQAAMAFSSPPSAFSTPRQRRRSTPSRRARRNYPLAAHDPPVVPPLLSDSEGDSQPTEVSDYEPATYRTRRRSATVATVHRWAGDEGIVDDQGRFVARARKVQERTLRSTSSTAAERRAVRLARKIASMGSLFHSDAGRPDLRIHTKRPVLALPEGVGQIGLERMTSSESSEPSSPATPADAPLSGEEPEGRAALPRATPFLFGDDPGKLVSKMNEPSLQRGHNRMYSVL